MPYREPEHHEREPSAPAYVEGPMPWENAALSWPRRFFDTLNASFSPTTTARAVAENQRLVPGLGFALLSALPWAPLWAIIPFTHTLMFKPSFGLEVLTKPGLSVSVDVVRAAAIGLSVFAISTLTWCVPFASLLKAFARPADQTFAAAAAYRTVLYRMWLLPFGMTLLSLAIWALPPNPAVVFGDLIVVCFQLLPRLLILLHCHAMARYFGASSAGALAVSVVPWAFEMAASLWIQQVVQGFLPEIPPDAASGGG